MARAIPSCATAASLLALRLRQNRICHNHANGGGKRGLRLCVRSRQRLSLGRSWGGKQLHVISPQPAGRRVNGRSYCVHHNSRCNGDPGVELLFRVAKACFDASADCASARANRASRRLVAGCRGQSQRSEVCRRPIAKDAASAEVEEHRGRHDRNDLMGFETGGEPYTGCLETDHYAVRCRQSVRAPAGEHDRMHPLDDRRWMQEVGLSSSRATAAYVHPADSAVAGHHDGRPRQPAVAVGSVVPNLKTLDHPLPLLMSCSRSK